MEMLPEYPKSIKTSDDLYAYLVHTVSNSMFVMDPLIFEQLDYYKDLVTFNILKVSISYSQNIKSVLNNFLDILTVDELEYLQLL